MFRILDYAVEIFFVWLLYKLVFELIIPVYQSTKQFRKQMNEVRHHMQDQATSHSANPSPEPPHQVSEKEGEYIDFEDVK